MDSFFAKNRLSAYLDGDLQEPEASEVAAAIERDDDLRAEYENLRRSINLLRKAGPVKAPPGFHARIMEKIRDEPHPGGVVITLQRLVQRVPVEAVALVAAAAVVLMVVNARSNHSAGDGAPSVSESSKQQAVASSPAGTDLIAPVVGTREADADQDPSVDSPSPTSELLSEEVAPDDNASFAQVRAYSLSSYDPDILHQIARILQGAGDEAGMFQAAPDDSGPKALGARMLTADDDFQRVFLAIPVEQQTPITEALEKLNATYIPAGLSIMDQGPVPSTSQAVFLVDVIYTPPL